MAVFVRHDVRDEGVEFSEEIVEDELAFHHLRDEKRRDDKRERRSDMRREEWIGEM